MLAAGAVYQPRAPEGGLLHTVIREHLETFLAEATRGSDGPRLPAFVEQEFRDYLTCGVLAHGFARRMAERAARLVTEVLPHVPVRQWVLSLPYRLRYLLAWNHELCRAVLAVFAGTVLGAYRRQARRRGIVNGQTGTFTVIQRFGGGLNLNVHFHTLVLDGVYAESGGALVFHGAAPPTDVDVGRVVVTVRRKVLRLLTRRGFASDVEGTSDPLVEESSVLAGITGASVLGQIALGPRAGARVWRLGADPDAPWIASSGPAHAHVEGFDLHASVRVPGHDRRRLEHLCRYLLRPPLGQERLRRLPDGRVAVELKRTWADGTTHLVFTPLEFLEKLAALTPRPRVNLVLYHGVLAPMLGGGPGSCPRRWRPPGLSPPSLRFGRGTGDGQT